MASSIASSSITHLPLSIMSSLKHIFTSTKEKNIIIDPFSCIVKLCLLNKMPEGTKISIYENKIYFNEPNYAQGVIRFIYGDNREDLHNLFAPINKFVNWYWNDENTDMIEVFDKAVSGLKRLKRAYGTWATIQHTIDYYILILMRKKKLSDSQKSTIVKHNTHTQIIPKNISSTQKTYNYNSYGNNSDNCDDDNNINNSNYSDDNDNDNENDNDNDNDNDDLSGDDMQLYDNVETEITNDERIKRKLLNKAAMSDVQKFLKSLWSEREINIIINLLKELDAKKDDPIEKESIYESIMTYCNTKEKKLFKYIEESSSFL